MRMGHEKARRRDMEREAVFAQKADKYRKERHGKRYCLGRSIPFRPGMYEGKSAQEVAAVVGTNIHHTFVSAKVIQNAPVNYDNRQANRNLAQGHCADMSLVARSTIGIPT